MSKNLPQISKNNAKRTKMAKTTENCKNGQNGRFFLKPLSAVVVPWPRRRRPRRRSCCRGRCRSGRAAVVAASAGVACGLTSRVLEGASSAVGACSCACCRRVRARSACSLVCRADRTEAASGACDAIHLALHRPCERRVLARTARAGQRRRRALSAVVARRAHLTRDVALEILILAQLAAPALLLRGRRVVRAGRARYWGSAFDRAPRPLRALQTLCDVLKLGGVRMSATGARQWRRAACRAVRASWAYLFSRYEYTIG